MATNIIWTYDACMLTRFKVAFVSLVERRNKLIHRRGGQHVVLAGVALSACAPPAWSMSDAGDAAESHVRVRHGKTTAFVPADIAGGATGLQLKAAAAVALSLDADALLLYHRPARAEAEADDDDEADAETLQLKTELPLLDQGVAIDDLIVATTRRESGDWEAVDESLFASLDVVPRQADRMRRRQPGVRS